MIPLLQLTIFFLTRTFPKNQSVPPLFFSVLSDKKISTNRDTPIWHVFFNTRRFLNYKGPPLRNFTLLWNRKRFARKSWYYPLLSEVFFPFQKLSERQKFSPTMFFGTVRLKNFDGKTWYPPIKHNLFHTKNFLKKRKVPLQIFSALWDKMFPTKIFDTPSYPK